MDFQSLREADLTSRDLAGNVEAQRRGVPASFSARLCGAALREQRKAQQRRPTCPVATVSTSDASSLPENGLVATE
jgi:hypothetical protein